MLKSCEVRIFEVYSVHLPPSEPWLQYSHVLSAATDVFINTDNILKKVEQRLKMLSYNRRCV